MSYPRGGSISWRKKSGIAKKKNKTINLEVRVEGLGCVSKWGDHLLLARHKIHCCLSKISITKGRRHERCHPADINTTSRPTTVTDSRPVPITLHHLLHGLSVSLTLSSLARPPLNGQGNAKARLLWGNMVTFVFRIPADASSWTTMLCGRESNLLKRVGRLGGGLGSGLPDDGTRR